MRKKFLFLMMLIGVSYFTCLDAQIVKGRVIDADSHKPIAYATAVFISLPDSVQVSGAVSKRDGTFTLKRQGHRSGFVRVSFVGYQTMQKKISDQMTFSLKQSSNNLDALIVKGSRQLYTVSRDGNIITNVQGTILAKQPNVMMMLSKVPGLLVRNKSISTFVGGEPTIYINDRKIQNFSEVLELEVRDIKSIELVTSPGAKYDANTDAVLLIYTYNPLAGFSARTELYAALFNNKKTDKEITNNFHYKTGKWSIASYIDYNPYNSSFSNDVNVIVDPKISYDHKQWKYSIYANDNTKNKNLSYSLGLNYQIDKNKEWGIRYQTAFSKSNDNLTYPSILRHASDIDSINGNSHIFAPSYRHSLNTYYVGQLSDIIKLEVYANGLISQNKSDQSIVEQSQNASLKRSFYSVFNRNYLVGLEPRLTLKLSPKQFLMMGVAMATVYGRNSSEYQGDQTGTALPTLKTKVYDNSIRLYTNYSVTPIQGLTLMAGLSYQLNKYKLKDELANRYIRDTLIQNIAPTFKVNYNYKGLTQSLTYRIRIRNPRFNSLNGNTFYANQFLRRDPNPYLLRSIYHKFNYKIGYKIIFLTLEYDHIKDDIANIFYIDEAVPSTGSLLQRAPKLIDKPFNVDYSNNYKAEISGGYRFGFYQPIFSLAFGYSQRKIDNKLLRGSITRNRPYGYVYIDNNFDLSHNWFVDVNYTYATSSLYDLYLVAPTQWLNCSVTKSWLNGNLSCTLSVKDILNKGSVQKSLIDYNGFFLQTINNNHQQRISLDIVWHFNNYKSERQYDNAAQSEIDRL